MLGRGTLGGKGKGRGKRGLSKGERDTSVEDGEERCGKGKGRERSVEEREGKKEVWVRNWRERERGKEDF